MKFGTLLLHDALGVIVLTTVAVRGASADHLDPPVRLNSVRPAMPNEGYLTFKPNPIDLDQFGEEWTGWVDVRHPAMDGSTQTFDPFDRSNRFANVKTIIVSDSNGVAARPNNQDAATGIGIRRDFDYANKIWAQLGLSIIRTEHGTLSLDGTGGAPSLAWPINRTTDDDAMKGV
jgi:hypothetical protein